MNITNIGPRALSLLAPLIVSAGAVHAAAVEYTLTVPYADVVLGGTNYAYNGYWTRFIFDGDDANVVNANGLGVAFSAIFQGTAGVQILNHGSVVTTAVFAPNQIVVTADRSNGGLGFGFVPGGVGATGLDIGQLQPLYPMSISNYGRGAFGYDTQYNLTLAFATAHAGQTYSAPSIWPSGVLPFASDGSADVFGAVYSCNGFSGFLLAAGCFLGSPIHTNLGDFTINTLMSLQGLEPSHPGVPMVGEFTARAVSSVPEPSGWMLFVAGGLAVCALARCQRSKGHPESVSRLRPWSPPY